MTVATEEHDPEAVHQGVVFTIGDEEYCIDIADIDEIVERGSLTALPNAADHFEGVMDLRGETTTIFNPRSYFDTAEADEGGTRILILDREDQNVGWLVDSVHRVIEFTDEDVESNVSDGPVEGVLRQEDGFVILVDPSAIADNR